MILPSGCETLQEAGLSTCTAMARRKIDKNPPTNFWLCLVGLLANLGPQSLKNSLCWIPCVNVASIVI